jgi:ribonuclease HI
MTTYVLMFDGGSRGNPGKGGAGSVLYVGQKEIWSEAFYVGDMVTNNHAEYTGLLRGLQELARRHLGPHDRIHIKGDSLLVIRQMQGLYQCRAPLLQQLHQQCLEAMKDYSVSVSFEHIPRSMNARADALANQAMNL